MIKKITTKLVLKKETVSNFEMEKINGGIVRTIDCTDWHSCKYSICCEPD